MADVGLNITSTEREVSLQTTQINREIALNVASAERVVNLVTNQEMRQVLLNIASVERTVVLQATQTIREVSLNVVNNPVVRELNVNTSVVKSNSVNYECGENIASHKALALFGGKVYKMDYSNMDHRFAFVGFSKTSGVTGGFISIEDELITLSGWGLTPNQTYLAGPNGSIIASNATAGTFIKIVGVAQDASTLLICRDYDSIIKN